MKGRGSRRKPAGRRQKHNAFYRLLEACREAECPLCALARRRVKRYFEGLLYEKVNDPELRKRIRSAGGFCNRHSFQFAEYHDGLAGSILYRDLLETWLQRPSAMPVQSSDGRLPDCPACREKAQAEQRALSLLTAFLDDEELHEALRGSSGLCLPHLGMLEERLGRGRKALPGWLADLQRAVVEKIAADLRACLDSRNYSLGTDRPALSREQELAWERAVRMVAGFPAVD